MLKIIFCATALTFLAGAMAPDAHAGRPRVWNAKVSSSGSKTGGSALSAAPLPALGINEFEVRFPANVANCTYHATLGSLDAVPVPPGFAITARRAGVPSAVRVSTFAFNGTAVARDFHLIVVC